MRHTHTRVSWCRRPNWEGIISHTHSLFCYSSVTVTESGGVNGGRDLFTTLCSLYIKLGTHSIYTCDGTC